MIFGGGSDIDHRCPLCDSFVSEIIERRVSGPQQQFVLIEDVDDDNNKRICRQLTCVASGALWLERSQLARLLGMRVTAVGSAAKTQAAVVHLRVVGLQVATVASFAPSLNHIPCQSPQEE